MHGTAKDATYGAIVNNTKGTTDDADINADGGGWGGDA